MPIKEKGNAKERAWLQSGCLYCTYHPQTFLDHVWPKDHTLDITARNFEQFQLIGLHSSHPSLYRHVSKGNWQLGYKACCHVGPCEL